MPRSAWLFSAACWDALGHGAQGPASRPREEWILWSRVKSGLRVGGWVLLACLAGFGCRTAGSRSEDMATVVIRGKSEEQIRQAATEVFLGAHYQPGAGALRELVFERKAGALSNVLYGGWPGADPSVWERVKLTFLPKEDGSCVVGLNAFLVSDRGENFFENETRRSGLQRASYRKLLRAVQDKLK